MQIVALHEKMAQELNDRFGVDNTAVIRNGIMMERFTDPGLSKEEKRMEIGIPEDAFVVGHVGRFFEQKNHPFLVEVFREIAARQEKAFLLMVGAGDTTRTEETLKQYGLGDRYLILSHRQDIPQLLAAMDLFLLPSLFEGLPVTLIETQASGLPALVSDRVTREMDMVGLIRFLPLEEDAACWADAIANAQINEDRSAYARKVLEAGYDICDQAHKLGAFYLNRHSLRKDR
jgi:glycosyltransferase involved in cell wall biosynthesis